MSSAVFAHGTLLKAGNGAATEVFTTIAEVTSIGGPGLALDPIEVTNMDSTNGWREFIGGLLDGGEVSISINYLPTNATHNASNGLINDMENRTKRNLQLIFSDGSSTTFSFTALVTAFEPTAPVDGALTADVTLKVTGQPTLA
jgi:predicted secreted protein